MNARILSVTKSPGEPCWLIFILSPRFCSRHFFYVPVLLQVIVRLLHFLEKLLRGHRVELGVNLVAGQCAQFGNFLRALHYFLLQNVRFAR